MNDSLGVCKLQFRSLVGVMIRYSVWFVVIVGGKLKSLAEVLHQYSFVFFGVRFVFRIAVYGQYPAE